MVSTDAEQPYRVLDAYRAEMNRRRRHVSLAGRTRRLMEQANDTPRPGFM